MMEDASALGKILARQEITDCLLRYTRGLDRLDEDLLRSAYWEDATTCHGAVNGSVDDFLSWWLPLQEGREAGQHAISNISISFASEDEADVESYFLASIKRAGEPGLELLGGRYVDRMSRRGSTWRISTRLLIFEWQAVADASAMDARLETCHRGTRDRTDPSYESPVRPRPFPG